MICLNLQLDYLKLICEFLDVPATNPPRFISHRWLSAYDVVLSIKRMLPALRILYYGFMKKQDQDVYKEVLQDMYREHEVSDQAQRRIELTHKDLCKKGMFVPTVCMCACM